MVRVGYNWRLNEVAAVIGKHQLRQLETFVKKRNAIAQSYNRLLKDTVGVSLFPVPANIRHSYYKYPLKLDPQIDAAKVGGTLKEQYGVETGNIYYPPCHLHSFYRENFGAKEGDLPVSEAVLKSVLCLPMHPAVTEEDTAYVVEALTACLSEMEVS
jgi:perosamine synthetase